jgi:hypothetical protein
MLTHVRCGAALTRRRTKWIIGTWLMETERQDGAEIAKAIDELWKLARKS